MDFVTCHVYFLCNKALISGNKISFSSFSHGENSFDIFSLENIYAHSCLKPLSNQLEDVFKQLKSMFKSWDSRVL